MATDLQFIFPSEALPLTNIEELPREAFPAPRRLRLTGHDFRAVAEILLNGAEASTFTVLSETKLLVEVPDTLGEDTIVRVEVLSARVTLTDRSLLRFRLGSPTRKTAGILRLMQFYLRVLITTPSRDIFAPTIGGDALAAIGGTAGNREGQDVLAGLIVAVGRTTRQVIALQARDIRSPREERLLSARIESAQVERASSSLVATIALKNQSGREGRALVTV